MSKVLISGAAEGADTHFAKCAIENGFQVHNMTFSGHRRSLDVGVMDELDSKDLSEADDHLEIAAHHLHRTIPKYGIAKKFLQRNYHQIKDTDQVVAVGWFEQKYEDHHLWRNNVGIEGGTAWTCQLYTQRMLSENRNGLIPLWFFDQHFEEWYRCEVASVNETTLDSDQNSRLRWIPDHPPISSNRMTGIGSRKLTNMGARAIESVFESQK